MRLSPHKKVDKATSFAACGCADQIIIRDNPQVESIQRGVGGDTAAAGSAAPDTAAVERELGEIERQMAELEKDREDRSRRIMDRRVLQVTTLQELGENPSLQIQFEASNI